MPNLSKIPFEIYESSGSDLDHPAQDLVNQKFTPFQSGWKSPRFCEYPQHITIKVSPNYRLLKLQLLMHHYLIPTKIMLYAGKEENKLEKLGYVTFADNCNNSFKFRELKTIHLDLTTNFLKFEIQKCFVNELNLYNQVGLVAINPMGVLEIGPGSVLDGRGHNPILQGIINKSDRKVLTYDQDLEYFNHDRFIVKCISQIGDLKKRAVEDENYIRAKQLKMIELQFTKSAGDLAEITRLKLLATKTENYDEAQSQNVMNFL
jgi:centrosomal protein CEP104